MNFIITIHNKEYSFVYKIYKYYWLLNIHDFILIIWKYVLYYAYLKLQNSNYHNKKARMFY